MSQVKPGGQGSGQGPGPQARKPTPPRRPAAKPGAKRPTTGSGGGGKGAPGKGGPGKGTGRPNKVIAAPPPRRFSPSTMAFVAVGLVVVIVLVFVVVKITGGSTPSATGGPGAPTAAPASLVSEVTGVPDSVIESVGLGSGVSAPTHMSGQPPLTSGGKPEVLFIGAEFCPYCAAERWAIVNALGRFGTWSGLQETTSSPWDADPSTATFSFRDAALTSQYIDFVSIEHETNDTSGIGTRKALQPLTTAQSNLWTKYSSDLGISTGYPFVDLGNKVFVAGPSYNPQILAGLDQAEIASNLTNPSSAITKAIVGTANYLTAAVCSMTQNQPSSVCSAPAVHQAATALHVS